MFLYTLGTLDLWQKADHPFNICLDVLHSDQGLIARFSRRWFMTTFQGGWKFRFWAPWSVGLMLSQWAEPPGHWRLWKGLSSFLAFSFSLFSCWVSLGFGACMWYFVSQKLLQDLIIWNKQEQPLFPFQNSASAGTNLEWGAEIALVSAGSLCEQVCVEAGSCLFGRDMFVESQRKLLWKRKPRHLPRSYVQMQRQFIIETAPDRDRRSWRHNEFPAPVEKPL